jgi:hypothetical protein
MMLVVLIAEYIWKVKIPEKIRIFMWLVEQKAILTKDNMIKRKWTTDPGCYFCGQFDTTTDHLLFDFPMSKVVWGLHYASIKPLGQVIMNNIGLGSIWPFPVGSIYI